MSNETLLSSNKKGFFNLDGKLGRWKEILFVFAAMMVILLVTGVRFYWMTDFMIFCILALGYVLLYGFMGHLSFGHYLYYGIGAYSAGLWIHYVYGDPLIAILVGVGISFGFAALIGLVVTRVKGPAFPMINMAFNQVGVFFIHSVLSEYTRGDDGLTTKPNLLFGKFWLSHDVTAFIFVLIIFLAVFAFLAVLIRSSYGTAVKSINENETRVKFLGYDTLKLKWITFVIASTIAGVAGVLYTLTQGFVTPNVMNTFNNINVIFAILIGGGGSLYGAVFGGMIYMLIRSYVPLLILNIESAFAISIPQWEFWLGIILLVIVFTIKTGIVGIITNAAQSRKMRIEQGSGVNV